jgi:hypothetical protein
MDNIMSERKNHIKNAYKDYKNSKLMAELYKRPVKDSPTNTPKFNVLEEGSPRVSP